MSAQQEERVYCLQVVEANHADNAFYVLGGAGWLTASERDIQFARIPSAVNDDDAKCWYILDVLDPDGIIDDKTISADAARALLGCSIEWRRRVVKRDLADEVARMEARSAVAS